LVSGRSRCAHRLVTLTVPCDVTFNVKAEDGTRRDLLLLPPLRRLLRYLLRFSLLRHCCPPSHDMWRCRNSAVANRRALHPDYTSTTKKTLTPLNRTCTRPQTSSDTDGIRRTSRTFAAHACAQRRIRARKSDAPRKPIWHLAFHAHRRIQFRRAFDRGDTDGSPSCRRKVAPCAGFAQRKNFFPQMACKCLDIGRKRSKTRESAAGDSAERGAHTMP